MTEAQLYKDLIFWRGYKWEDSQQPAIALRDVGSNIPVLTQYGTTGIWLPKFDVDDMLVFDIQLQHKF